MRTEHSLTYDSPAADWLAALPLGNGRLGAMVFGGAPVPGQPGLEHRFQLNDGSAWSGSPHSQDLGPAFSRKSADAILAAARGQISAGDFGAAHETMKQLQHRNSQAYLPFADFFLAVAVAGDSGAPAGYGRSLDLARAVNSTRYQQAGHNIRIEAFAAHHPSVLVVTVESGAPQGLDLALRLDSPLRILRRTAAAGTAAMELKLPSGVAPSHDGGAVDYSDDDSLSLQGAAVMSWEHDGTDAAADDGGLAATGVHRATVFITTETTFHGLGRQPQGTAAGAADAARALLASAAATGPAGLLERHEASHAALYDSCSLTLDVPPWQGTNTAERLLAANRNPAGPLAADPGLAALLFNYGRYLLICSSRAGHPGSRPGTAWQGTPANLQGIWNAELTAPWSSNFTTNINLQMNYWAAEPTGLAACAEPLFALIEALQVTGARTAREYYGADGWAVHHNSDIWGYSKPVGHGRHSPEWSYWPMAGLWLVRHLWEHLQFGAAGPGFARDAAWPAVRGAAAFALDLLLENPDGTLGTSPSTSPENSFTLPGGGGRAAVAESSTLDLTLIRDTFLMVDALAAGLGQPDDAVAAAARRALPRLPEPAPGRNGRLREWLADPEEWEQDHRHVSHLYLAYPGDTPLAPELEAAVKASLDGRGDESTGWSLAWKILLRARLRQPEKVSDLFRLYFRDMAAERSGHSGGLYPNLFGAHPPFQIDGNFGFVAGVAECLVQSHRTAAGVQEIELLPALPAELPAGKANRLRARPGVEVDLEWRDGRLAGATLAAQREATVQLRSGDKILALRLLPGEPAAITVGAGGGLVLNTASSRHDAAPQTT